MLGWFRFYNIARFMVFSSFCFKSDLSANWLVVAISFFVSLFFGGLFYIVFAKLRPFGVDLDDINKHPLSIGVFLFCYEVFLGLIMLASLTLPIG
jgi:hypothetical protein